MGVKRKQHSFSSHFIGDFLQFIQDGAVAKMHAVKCANGNNGITDILERIKRGMNDHKLEIGWHKGNRALQNIGKEFQKLTQRSNAVPSRIKKETRRLAGSFNVLFGDYLETTN